MTTPDHPLYPQRSPVRPASPAAGTAPVRDAFVLAAVFALSIAATVATWNWQLHEENREHRRAFETLTARFQRDFKDQLEDYLGLLRGTAGLVTASQRVSAEEWTDYVGQLNLPRNYPGVKALGYVPLIGHGELDRWLREMQAEQKGYAIFPLGDREQYQPLALVEPRTWDNVRALGFDQATDPVRRKALEVSRDEAEGALTGLLHLTGDGGGRRALLLFYPVFRGRMPPAGRTQRRDGLVGHVAVAFVLDEFMAPLDQRYQQEVGLRMYDASSDAGGELLFAPDDDRHSGTGRFLDSGELNFAGRRLRLEFHSEAGFDAATDHGRSAVVLLAGMVFSVLISLLILNLAGGRRRAEALALRMTENLRASEERFDLVVKGTVGGIWDLDLSADALYLSDRVEELLGHRVGSLDRRFAAMMGLVHPEDRAELRRAARAHLDGGAPLEADCRVLRADGEWGWFRVRGQAVRDADGQATRIAGSFADIARERQAAEQAARSQAFLRRVIDNLPDPFTLKSEDLTILMANQAYSRFLQLPLDQIVGHRSSDFLPQPSGVEVERLDRLSFLSGAPQTVQKDIRDGRGRVRHVLVKKVPCEGIDGEPALIGLFIDVTQEQEALERFEAIIENTPTVAIQGFATDGTVRHWNRAAAALYGYGRQQAVGRRMQELLYAPHSAREFEASVARLLGTDAALPPVEVERVLPDGRRFWVYTSMFPVFKDGAVAEIFSMEVDVTERKKAEMQLRESEARWQFALEGSGEGVWDWDVRAAKVHFSPRWKAMLGFAPHELTDSLDEWKQRVHPEDIAPVLEAVQRHLRGETGHYQSEHRLRRKDGQYIWILDRGKVVERDAAGHALRVIGTHADMTQRKLAAERIAESERRFRMLSDSAPVLIWMCDSAGRPNFVNKVWSDFTGLDETRTTAGGLWQGVHPDDAPQVAGQFDAALSRHLPFEMEFRLLRADGSYRWVRDNGVPRFEADGTFLGFVGSVFDVTERREAEEALRRSRDSLQDLVLEQTADLRRAKEAAEEANAAKSRFLANMSHELRTPLHAILSFARLGEGRSATAPQGKLREYFDRIHVSGERLLALLNDLLDLSRLEAGRAVIDSRPCDLTALVEEARAEFETLLAGKDLSFSVDCATPLLPVQGDPAQIGRVIRNLLSNAIKFSPASRAIRVGLAPFGLPAERSEFMAAPPEAVEMVVSDHGVGIPESELESVFDKFVQSSKTRSGAGGTGLGLAICREIVLAHGGEIFARGNADGGADIVVRLPAFRGRGAESESPELEVTT